jgi:hypothetical protein
MSNIRALRLAAALLMLATAMPANAVGDPYEDLLTAIQNRDLDSVKALIARGMEVDTVDRAGNTLLMMAARAGNDETVIYLVATGAKVNKRNRFNESALMLAALAGHLVTCQFLIDHDADVDHDGWRPLIYAAFGGHNDVIRLLLALNVDIDGASENGTTALMMAAQAGHVATVKLLLGNRADADLKNEAGLTALKWAVKQGHADVASVLRGAGTKK